jgi:hypothetical protein
MAQIDGGGVGRLQRSDSGSPRTSDRARLLSVYLTPLFLTPAPRLRARPQYTFAVGGRVGWGADRTLLYLQRSESDTRGIHSPSKRRRDPRGGWEEERTASIRLSYDEPGCFTENRGFRFPKEIEAFTDR